MKSQFFDRRLTLNATAYRTELKDFQDRSFDGTSFVFRNAGELRHQGVELEASARIGGGFSLSASAAYLDSEFTDFRNAPALPGCAASSPAIEGCGPVGGVRTVQDLTGKRAHYAPEWQGNLTAQYETTFTNGWSLRALGGASFIDDQFVGSVTDNNSQTLQKGYTLFNARLAIATPGDELEFALFGENLSDKGYCSNMIYQPSDNLTGVRNPATGGTLVRCIVGNPRTYGVSAKIRF